MGKFIAGYGIKVETDTGHFVWLTKEGTSNLKAKAMKFDSEAGATMECNLLSEKNPHANLIVKKLSE